MSRRFAPIALFALALCALAPSVAPAAPAPADYCGPYQGLRWLTGMEHGRTSTGGGGIWWPASDAGGPAAADASVVRSGDYSLRIAPNGGPTYRGSVVEYCPIMTVRFAIRLESAPASDVTELFSVYTAANTATSGPKGALQLGYDAGTGAFRVRARPGEWQLASVPVQPGAWHVIDLKYDVSASTNRVDWRVDAVDQPQATGYEAPSTTHQFLFGTTFAETFTANYDDMMLAIAPASDPVAWYPYGDGQIQALEPDGMGASSGASRFREGDASTGQRWALGSGSWSALADRPVVPDTTFLEQVSTSKSSFAEVTFQDTLEPRIRALGAIMTYDPLNTRSANDGRAAVVGSGIDQTVYAGKMAYPYTYLYSKSAVIKRPAGGWTTDLVNGLRGRVGFSADANPAPRWTSLMLEYEVPRP